MSFRSIAALLLGAGLIASGLLTPTAIASAAAPTDLELTQTAAPSPVAVGGELVWTITVSNLGPGDAAEVEANGNFNPNEVTTEFVSLATTQGACTQSGSTFNCQLGSIANGGSATMTLTVKVLKPGAVGHTGDVTTGSGDTNWSNNHVTDTIAAKPGADLEVMKTSPIASAAPGDAVEYDVTVRNHGPSTAEGAILTDLIPTGLVDARIDPADGCSVGDTEIVCELGDLASGSSVSFSVSAVVDGFTGDSVVNTATVASASPDGDPSNDSATAVIGIDPPSADLSVVKSLDATDPAPVAGEVVRYRISVANDGPSAAEGATLADVLPSALTDVSVATEFGDCEIDAGVLSCDFGTIPSGARFSMLVVALVAADADGALVNTAIVDASTPDPDMRDNSSTASDEISRVADVSLAKTASSAQAGNGDPIVYTLTVRNTGPSDAPNTIVRDVLPDHLEYTPGSCIADQGACAFAAGVLEFDLGTVANGATHVLTFSATVSADAPDEVLGNTATVAHGAQDPDPENNSATYQLNVDAAADLVLVKTPSSATATAGGTVEYRLAVRNDGPGESTGLVLRDALPAAVSEVVIDGGGGSCGVDDANVVTCALPALAAEDVWTVTVAGRIDPAFGPGALRNTAMVFGDDDPTLSNNVSTAVVPVRARADLSIDKQAEEFVLAGGEASYSIEIVNAGPSAAAGTVLIDRLPIGTTFVSGGGDEVSCEAASTDLRLVRCEIGLLDAGASASFTVTVAVGASVPPGTVLVNTAAVVSATPGLSDGLVASAASEVIAEANLSIVKSVSPDAPVAGGPVAYTLRVHNAGPSTATALELTDLLPAGIALDEAVANAGACDEPDAGDLACSRDSLAPGATWTVFLRGTVEASATGSIVNRAEVVSGTPDPHPDDNSATVAFVVGTAADLLAGKWTPTPVRTPGQTAVFVLSVHNSGPSTAREVEMIDELPIGLGQVSALEGPCAIENRTVVCEYDAIPAGDTRVALVMAQVDQAAPVGRIVNGVGVSAETPDPRPESNTASAVLNVVAAPPPPTEPGPDPELPSTGYAPSGILPAALMLLALGVAAIAVAAVRRERA